MAPKTAYQRPYKSRNQRREIDRRKIDPASDQKFLYKVAGGVIVLIIIVIAFAIKGTSERNQAAATSSHSAAVE